MGTFDGYLIALDAQAKRQTRSPRSAKPARRHLLAALPRAKRGVLHQFDGERNYVCG